MISSGSSGRPPGQPINAHLRQREKLVSDVMRAYSRIGQLFGTDRTFYFAVHFGNATDGPFDKAKCPELLKKLRESVLVRRTDK
jgi:hypothetical protein